MPIPNLRLLYTVLACSLPTFGFTWDYREHFGISSVSFKTACTKLPPARAGEFDAIGRVCQSCANPYIAICQAHMAALTADYISEMTMGGMPGANLKSVTCIGTMDFSTTGSWIVVLRNEVASRLGASCVTERRPVRDEEGETIGESAMEAWMREREPRGVIWIGEPAQQGVGIVFAAGNPDVSEDELDRCAKG